MKKFLPVVFAIFLVSQLFAQKISYGPAVGLNFATLSFEGQQTTAENEFTYTSKGADHGIVAGGYVQVSFNNFFIRQQLLYSQKKTNLLLTAPGIEQDQLITFNNVQLPLMVGFQMNNGFSFSGGAVASTMLDGSIIPAKPRNWKLSDCSYAKTSMGLKVGMGYRINRVNLDLFFERNVSKLGVDMVSAGERFSFDYNTQSIQTTFSYRISKQ